MNFFSFNQLPLYTDDFFFTFSDNAFVKDAIVVFNPADAMIVTPVYLRSRKSLGEHIEYIRTNQYKKAIVVGDDIEFLKLCPSLEYLKIHPSIDADNFDYSPLYELPNLKTLLCDTMYGLRAVYDVEEKVKIATVDYSRFHDLRELHVFDKEGHLNVHAAEKVRCLRMGGGFPKSQNLKEVIPVTSLRCLSICDSPIASLSGIENAAYLCRLELTYNLRLEDISALYHLRNTLGYLEIDRCGKIKDFSVLSELHNLEFLTLKGSNVLPDLSFIKEMPKLKNLHITMNIANGDLGICESLPYVCVKNRKHFSHKDNDLPKNYVDPDMIYPFSIY